MDNFRCGEVIAINKPITLFMSPPKLTLINKPVIFLSFKALADSLKVVYWRDYSSLFKSEVNEEDLKIKGHE